MDTEYTIIWPPNLPPNLENDDSEIELHHIVFCPNCFCYGYMDHIKNKGRYFRCEECNYHSCDVIGCDKCVSSNNEVCATHQI